jgi:hypothetical protein
MPSSTKVGTFHAKQKLAHHLYLGMEDSHLQGPHVATPKLVGTILPGVTRDSVLQLARDAGLTVEEADVPVADALAADEVFTSGAQL